MSTIPYTIDPRHSQLHFDIEHLEGLSVLTVRFTGLSGSLILDNEKGTVSLEASIDARTVSSALPTFDPLLVGPNMFEVEQFPSIELDIPVIHLPRTNVDAGARLVVRGISKQVPVTILSAREGKNRRDESLVGIRASLPVRRSDFGMDVHLTPTLSDAIRLTINIEAIRAV